MVADACALPALLRSAFEARGEKKRGPIKMWTAHSVQVPIWGYCTDRTTRELQTAPVQSVKALADLRIEPEIMFGLVR
jgi:hypothetical protein